MGNITKLASGIDIKNMGELEDAFYEKDSHYIEAILDVTKLSEFLTEYSAILYEPLSFFLEVPCTDFENKELSEMTGTPVIPHYKVYYLDDCPTEKLHEIFDRYGSLLINDGCSRFGFGRSDIFDDIYIKDYNVIELYFCNKQRQPAAKHLLRKLGAKRVTELLLPQNIISKANPAQCTAVEENGVTVAALPELLGMRFNEIID